MTARTESIASKITKHFAKYPDAIPAEVAKKFGGSIGNVYNYRRRALTRVAGKETQVFFSKKTVDEALTPEQATDAALGLAIATAQRWKETSSLQKVTYTDSWLGYGAFLSRDEYRGYLRGRVVDLMRNGLQDNFDEAMRCADKLTQLAKSEGE